MTRFWLARSTKVPASEPKTRFGTVAAKKTKLTAMNEPVSRRTKKPSTDLVDPVAEEAEQAAGPQRRERAG